METLDLRGLLCPLTWARTKYALSRLLPGTELRVVVDHRPAVPDIKRFILDKRFKKLLGAMGKAT